MVYFIDIADAYHHVLTEYQISNEIVDEYPDIGSEGFWRRVTQKMGISETNKLVKHFSQRKFEIKFFGSDSYSFYEKESVPWIADEIDEFSEKWQAQHGKEEQEMIQQKKEKKRIRDRERKKKKQKETPAEKDEEFGTTQDEITSLEMISKPIDSPHQASSVRVEPQKMLGKDELSDVENEPVRQDRKLNKDVTKDVPFSPSVKVIPFDSTYKIDPPTLIKSDLSSSYFSVKTLSSEDTQNSYDIKFQPGVPVDELSDVENEPVRQDRKLNKDVTKDVPFSPSVKVIPFDSTYKIDPPTLIKSDLSSSYFSVKTLSSEDTQNSYDIEFQPGVPVVSESSNIVSKKLSPSFLSSMFVFDHKIVDSKLWLKCTDGRETITILESDLRRVGQRSLIEYFKSHLHSIGIMGTKVSSSK
ncbi:hypothetical protein ADUPG1_010489 [Aduncisulcus paluster]|uniref:Uncharacterized protein n=1 Tax=Aduncisulcus paluster TaxID=2918883 RepID=A0ABQ5JUI5_9EUKA|nr:hypothetical protein ADUPG1_010489 [Aduncisulcus paluster]